jgi:hypothetical protein
VGTQWVEGSCSFVGHSGRLLEVVGKKFVGISLPSSEGRLLLCRRISVWAGYMIAVVSCFFAHLARFQSPWAVDVAFSIWER